MSYKTNLTDMFLPGIPLQCYMEMSKAIFKNILCENLYI